MSIKSSTAIFGGASLSGAGGGYGFGEITESEAQKLIETAIELGIKTFDTAPIYGFGQSEKTLGLNIKRHREKMTIISKGGVSWHSTKRVNMTNDPETIEGMLHQSLRDLNTDYIDTYLIHYPDPKVDIRFALDVVEKARIQGKIVNIGLSNTHESDVIKGSEVCKISIIQNQCNLFYNDLNPLNEICQKMNIHQMGWGTLDKGILTGSVSSERKYEDSDFRSWAPWWKKSSWKERVSVVDKFKRRHPKVDLLLLALCFAKNNTDSFICGTKSIDKLTQLVSTAKMTIDNYELLLEDFPSAT